MERIGAYRVVRTLESGAGSEVLLAVSETFGVERKVVLKRIVPHARTTEALVARLTREAKAYAELAHPAIVRMYDLLEYEGLPVLVLEYVDGPSLEQLLVSFAVKKQRLSRPVALHLGAGVFAGLSAMHAAQPAPIMHRDMSPGNVLLTREGEVKLADMSFARAVGKGSADTARVQKGSMGYMAPEQASMEEITPRTDVYCGALLAREMLTGAPAFPAGSGVSHGERALRMARPALEPIEELCPDLPADVSGAIGVALRASQAERTIGALELHRLLHAHAIRLGGQAELRRMLEGFARAD
jgi:serine/threonine-protein kinase